MSDPFAPGLGSEPEPFDPRKHRIEADLERTARGDPAEGYRYEYRPTSDLPVPTPVDGFTFRYIRVSNAALMDTRNVAKRTAEGWAPCTPEEQPEVARLLGKVGVNADGNIEIGGLMLCKLPNYILKARTEYYQRMARQQMEGVDNTFLREQHAKMPKLAPERRTEVSFPGRTQG